MWNLATIVQGCTTSIKLCTPCKDTHKLTPTLKVAIFVQVTQLLKRAILQVIDGHTIIERAILQMIEWKIDSCAPSESFLIGPVKGYSELQETFQPMFHACYRIHTYMSWLLTTISVSTQIVTVRNYGTALHSCACMCTIAWLNIKSTRNVHVSAQKCIDVTKAPCKSSALV